MNTYFFYKVNYMFGIITKNLLWTESPFIGLTCIAVALLGWLYFMPLFYFSLVAFLFFFYFFRNPDRICIQAVHDASVIVCPADGRIVDIQKLVDNKDYGAKISIFLSPLDVHVNWIPITGLVQKIEYVPGKFMMAFLPKSSELNEHNDVMILHPSGKKFLVRQIAGTLARRIVCWIEPHTKVFAGQKYGMIKFSSRIDLFLPHDTIIEVNLKQTVKGGQTVLGRLQ